MKKTSKSKSVQSVEKAVETSNNVSFALNFNVKETISAIAQAIKTEKENRSAVSQVVSAYDSLHCRTNAGTALCNRMLFASATVNEIVKEHVRCKFSVDESRARVNVMNHLRYLESNALRLKTALRFDKDSSKFTLIKL